MGERLLCKQEVAGSIPAGSIEAALPAGGRSLPNDHAHPPSLHVPAGGGPPDVLVTRVELTPWSVAVDHEDVNFATNSAAIEPAEDAKLDASLGKIGWLPSTCAYRLRAEDKPLNDWHYLISGDRETVHEAGMSVRGWTVSEDEAGDLEHHLVDRPL